MTGSVGAAPPPFDHHFSPSPVSTIGAYGITASVYLTPLPDTRRFFDPTGHLVLAPDTRHYFDPAGQEETKEEFDAAFFQWQTALDDAMRLKTEAEAATTTPDLSWKERLDAMIKKVLTEF